MRNLSLTTQSDLNLRVRLLLNLAICFSVYLALTVIGVPGYNLFTNVSTVGTGIEVIITFIIALIAALIGVSLISPVATTVGGALKNGNLTGAANSVTGQITLIFVTVVILGILVFLAVLGKFAAKESEGV